jgi:hypothetical protein
MQSVERKKRKRRDKKMWRHPINTDIRVPYKTAAAMAVMEMGITDYGDIAEAVGLSSDEVKRIDDVEDDGVRRLCHERIPLGEYFKLAIYLRCPRCAAKTTIAPCPTCMAEDIRPRPR